MKPLIRKIAVNFAFGFVPAVLLALMPVRSSFSPAATIALGIASMTALTAADLKDRRIWALMFLTLPLWFALGYVDGRYTPVPVMLSAVMCGAYAVIAILTAPAILALAERRAAGARGV